MAANEKQIRDRVNVGLSREIHMAASTTAGLLGMELQAMVDLAVQDFIESKKAETQKRMKQVFAAAA